MHIISVNIGVSQQIENAGKSGLTGIFKEPTMSPVLIAATGMAGDVVCDTRNHGGIDQAIYLYGGQDYKWWEKELGFPLAPGIFGENLTVAGLESAACHIGDRISLRDVILEVSAPRIPCGTLAARMCDPRFPKKFQEAERPGVYCRVIQEGLVQVGDLVSVEAYAGQTVSVIEMFRNFYRKDQDEAVLLRYLEAPIAIRARISIEQALNKLREETTRQRGAKAI